MSFKLQKSKMISNKQKRTFPKSGMTLTELAIVIVIVAVLASVAVPKLMNLQRTAQSAVAKDFLNVLRSGAGIYASNRNALPTSFTDFVTEGPLSTNAEATVSLAQMAQGKCKLNGVTINCPVDAFSDLGAFSYEFQTAEQINLNCPKCDL